MKKGMPRKVYSYTDRDIARIAGVSIGALRLAKFRKKLVPNDLRSVVVYVMEHWLKKMKGKKKG